MEERYRIIDERAREMMKEKRRTQEPVKGLWKTVDE